MAIGKFEFNSSIACQHSKFQIDFQIIIHPSMIVVIPKRSIPGQRLEFSDRHYIPLVSSISQHRSLESNYIEPVKLLKKRLDFQFFFHFFLIYELFTCFQVFRKLIFGEFFYFRKRISLYNIHLF